MKVYWVLKIYDGGTLVVKSDLPLIIHILQVPMMINYLLSGNYFTEMNSRFFIFRAKRDDVK